MPGVRFGTTRQRWRESVVAGTKARRRRHKRLSVRIRRCTRLWLAAPLSRREDARALSQSRGALQLWLRKSENFANRFIDASDQSPWEAGHRAADESAVVDRPKLIDEEV